MAIYEFCLDVWDSQVRREEIRAEAEDYAKKSGPDAKYATKMGIGVKITRLLNENSAKFHMIPFFI